MKRSKNTKRALLMSALSMMLCIAMLAGTTFAWFTDTVTSGKNRIVAGTLDVELFYKTAKPVNDDENAEGTEAKDPWVNVSDIPKGEESPFFLGVDGKAIKWEPGVMAYTYFKVENVGTLALTYKLMPYADEYNTFNGKDLRDAIKFAVIPGEAEFDLTQRTVNGKPISEINYEGFAASDQTGNLLSEEEVKEKKDAAKEAGETVDESVVKSSDIFTVIAYWEPKPNDEDNAFNVNNGGEAINPDGEKINHLWLNIDFRLHATQYTYEADSFNDKYDETAKDDILPKRPQIDLETPGVVDTGWHDKPTTPADPENPDEPGETTEPTEPTEFTISTKNQLMGLIKLVNEGNDFSGKTITLANDIQLDSSYSWIPIGTEGHPFNGTFDGNGKTISNMYYDHLENENVTAVGLFGVIGNATIKNLTVAGKINARVTTTQSDLNAIGGICGYVVGKASFEKCVNKVAIDCTNVSEAVTEECGAAVGGILGSFGMSSGGGVTIQNCLNEADITIGKPDVTATLYAGGITSLVMDISTLDTCKNKGNITSNGGANSFTADKALTFLDLFPLAASN